MKKETYLSVLEDTVKFYSEDVNRRSISPKSLGFTNCLYNGPDGRKCAFARCANPIPEKFEGRSASDVLRDYEGQILLDKYSHLTSPYFWNDLQNLHDEEDNWDTNGLTELGKNEVEELKIKISNYPKQTT